MQIPFGFHPKMSTKSALRDVAKALEQIVQGVGAAEGMRDWGGTPDKRPCAHADIDTAEALSVADHGYIEPVQKVHFLTYT